MPSNRPNIIFCHIDQLTHNAMSGVGCADVSTPNLDRIHRDGKSFARAQVTYPLCSPSRGAWFTGRLPSENGLISNESHGLMPDIPDLGQWLTARGYDCFYGGKWHVAGRDEKKSFKVIYPPIQVGERDDYALAQVAESFLHQRQGDKPFFLSLGFLNPHDVAYLDACQKDLATKLGVESHLQLPPLPPDYDPKKPVAGKVAGTWTPAEVSLYRYYYYRLVEQADAVVGRVYDAYRSMPDMENTLFIFLSDHGEMMGHHNRFKKEVLYDPALRVPLVFVQPGRIEAGARDLDHIVGGIDVTATILDYAGVEAMPDMTFARSIRPLIENTSTDWHLYVVAETNFAGCHQCFRSGKYKSMYNLDTNTLELYDTDADPYEQNNLAEQPAFAAVRKEHDGYRADYLNKLKPSPAYVEELTINGSGKGNKVWQASSSEFDKKLSY